ncbi:hypothetical protein J6590_006738 [Homalodisca vitripennis]|nr:hypothetical protein J6590_006738 [Homalodisca vitripennis]
MYEIGYGDCKERATKRPVFPQKTLLEERLTCVLGWYKLANVGQNLMLMHGNAWPHTDSVETAYQDCIDWAARTTP